MTPRALVAHGAALLREVLRFDAATDAVLAAYFRRQRALGARDRHLLAETVYTVLRHWRRFEWLARSAPPIAIPGPAGAGPHADPVDALALVLLGWPAGDGAVERACGSELQRWRDEALARLPPTESGDALRLGLPAWLADDLRAQLREGGEEELAALADALNRPAPLDLRVNLLKARRDAVQRALQADGVSSAPTRWSPWGLRVAGKPSLSGHGPLRRGEAEVQDEGSQLLALVVEARRGEVVVDFCAGAGGKTLALAAAMRNSGDLYALDTSGHRLEALRPRLARGGVSIVRTMQIAHERDDRLRRLAGKVDRVLVDAPCSGTGTLRRHPDLRWRHDAAAIDAFARRQRALLPAAAALVRPGGRLVYATCSLMRAENEAVADAFETEPGGMYRRIDVGAALANAGVPGVEALTTDRGDLRLWPHRHGTDGFYAAAWVRR
jgi:16S rRNA (cytosine967-C5)-methyltransferase